MKHIDYVRVQTRPTRKQAILSLLDAAIGTLVFISFAILSLGIIGLLGR